MVIGKLKFIKLKVEKGGRGDRETGIWDFEFVIYSRKLYVVNCKLLVVA
jgi:hypothetical protein